jgi:hypothetical protein
VQDAGHRSEAGKLYLLARAELRELWRWARQHLYTLLVLSPLVLGMTYLTLAQAASYETVFELPSHGAQVMLAVSGVLALLALNLSRASQELYHLREPASMAESLPVERATHLHLALVMRLGRTALLGLALLVLRSLLSDQDTVGASTFCVLALLVLLLSLMQTYAALNWIHWGSRRKKQEALLAAIVLCTATVVGGLLLMLFINPGAEIIRGLAVEQRAFAYYSIYATGFLCAGIIYVLMRAAHERWRATDIDCAKRLERGSRWRLNVPGIFKRRLPRSVTEMLARDLRLTLRTFSSAVYVAAGVCVLLVMLLVVLLTTNVLPPGSEFLGGLKDFDWLSATWLPAVIAIKLTCVLAVAAISAVLPVLVHYQLPHLWLERAAGATGEDVWLAKMWYARLLSLPVAMAVYVAGAAASVPAGESDGLPLYYILPLLAECLWLWWLVSSIVGVLAFEMPDRPELAIVLMITVGVSVGSLSAVLWPMGLAFYGMAIEKARVRGSARARYLLATEGE